MSKVVKERQIYKKVHGYYVRIAVVSKDSRVL